MRNWLGQEFAEGQVVYRGARDGNTSTFKIGYVSHLNEDKNTVSAFWIFEQSGGRRVPEQSFVGTKSTCNKDTLVVVDRSVLVGAAKDFIVAAQKVYSEHRAATNANYCRMYEYSGKKNYITCSVCQGVDYLYGIGNEWLHC